MGKALIIKGVNFFSNGFTNIKNVDLPEGYRLVSKLFNSSVNSQSDNEAYTFNTGVKALENYSIVGYFSFVNGTVNYATLFSSYDITHPSVAQFCAYRNGLDSARVLFKCYTVNSTNINLAAFGINPTEKNRYEAKGVEFFINNVLAYTQSQTPQPPTQPGVDTNFKLFIGDVIIYDHIMIKDHNGGIIFQGYPCVRESDNYAGIYDVISDTFISNGLENEYEE